MSHESILIGTVAVAIGIFTGYVGVRWLQPTPSPAISVRPLEAAKTADATAMWWLEDEPCGDARLVVTAEWIYCRDPRGWLHGPSTTIARISPMDPIRVRHEHYRRGVKHGPETRFTPHLDGGARRQHTCDVDGGLYHGQCQFFDLDGQPQAVTRFNRGSGLFLRYDHLGPSAAELWLLGEPVMSWWRIAGRLQLRVGRNDVLIAARVPAMRPGWQEDL